MKKRNVVLSILGLAVGFLNGFFGSGGGSLLVPILKYKERVEPKKAHATAIAVILPLCIVSSFFYIGKGMVDYKLLLWASIGGAAGGFIGAKLLPKIPAKYLKKVFGVVLVITAIRMFFR